jgi:hypothetical protein
MQQTTRPPYDKVDKEETQTKKCHLCEYDKYLSSFVFLQKEVAIDSNICVSCRRQLNREKNWVKKILNNAPKS